MKIEVHFDAYPPAVLRTTHNAVYDVEKHASFTTPLVNRVFLNEFDSSRVRFWGTRREPISPLKIYIIFPVEAYTRRCISISRVTAVRGRGGASRRRGGAHEEKNTPNYGAGPILSPRVEKKKKIPRQKEKGNSYGKKKKNPTRTRSGGGGGRVSASSVPPPPPTFGRWRGSAVVGQLG